MQHPQTLVYFPTAMSGGWDFGGAAHVRQTEEVLGDLYWQNIHRSTKSLAKVVQKELEVVTVKHLRLLDSVPLVTVQKTAAGDECLFVGINNFRGPLYRIDFTSPEAGSGAVQAVFRYSSQAIELLTVIQRIIFRFNGITLGEVDDGGMPSFRFKRFFPFVDFAPWLQKAAIVRLKEEGLTPTSLSFTLITQVPWRVPGWLGHQDDSYLMYQTYGEFRGGALRCDLSPDCEAEYRRACLGKLEGTL